MNLAAVRWVPIPHTDDDRGSLTVIESASLPFDIKRVFYLHRVPEGSERGAHAHRYTQQILIAQSGSLRIDVSDGMQSESFLLSDPNRGLYLPAMTWVRLYGFAPSTVMLVLCDRAYVREHVVRSWDEYCSLLSASPQTA